MDSSPAAVFGGVVTIVHQGALDPAWRRTGFAVPTLCHLLLAGCINKGCQKRPDDLKLDFSVHVLLLQYTHP